MSALEQAHRLHVAMMRRSSERLDKALAAAAAAKPHCQNERGEIDTRVVLELVELLVSLVKDNGVSEEQPE